MKRILPVVIAILFLAAVFCLIPRSDSKQVKIDTLDDLSGKTVGVQTGLNYEIALSERCPGAIVRYYSDFTSLIPAVQQGKLDSFLTESCSFYVEQRENPTLVAVQEPLEHVYMAVGVAQNAEGYKVKDELNEFIAKIKDDGEYDEMQKYWITDYDPDTATVDKSGITGERGVLKAMAEASYEPFCMTGAGGELLGYDVDMIYRFCREYGYEPDITPMDMEAMPAALASGKGTIAMGMLPDDERSEAVMFTDSYNEYDVIAAYNDNTISTGVSPIESVKNSFYKTFVKEERWKMFAQGACTTLIISFMSMIFGTLFGFLLYLWCANGKKAEQTVTNIICWLMGSTPTVVMLMILYYIIFGKYIISNVIVSIIGFSLLFGCNFYDLIVSGVKAVGVGQEEAARAQGFSKFQAFFQIILPQAAVHFFPGYKSEVVSLIQETSVVGYIAVLDLTKMSDMVRGRTYEAFFPLISTALIYFLLIWLLSKLVGCIQFRTDNQNRKKDRILKDIKTREIEQQ